MPANIGYAYDGGAAVAATSPQISGNTISVTAVAPVQGSHVVQLVNMDAPTMISAQSAQFTVGAAVVPATLAIDAIPVAAVSSIVNIAVTATGTPATDGTFNYGIDGSGLVAAASPALVAGQWVFSFVAPATAGTHTLVVQQGNSTGTTATVAFTTVATQVILPNNANIKYSQGNWNVTAAAAISVNPGADFEIFFSGSYVAITFDISLMGSPASEIYYQVDNYGPKVKATLTQGTFVPLIPTDTAAQPYHLLRVWIKATSQLVPRWYNIGTKASVAVKLTGITLASTAVLVPYIPRLKKILILGDSTGEGTLDVNSTAPLDPDQNDALMNWNHLMESMGVAVTQVGFGSQGFAKVGAGSVPGVEVTYNQIYDGVPRDLSVFDAVVVLHGSNDSSIPAATVSAAVTAMYNGMLEQVSAACQLIEFEAFDGTQWAAIQAGIAGCNDPSRLTTISTAGYVVAAYGVDTIIGKHPTGANFWSQIAPRMAADLYPLLFGPAVTARAPWWRDMLAS